MTNRWLAASSGAPCGASLLTSPSVQFRGSVFSARTSSSTSGSGSASASADAAAVAELSSAPYASASALAAAPAEAASLRGARGGHQARPALQCQCCCSQHAHG